MSAIVDKNGELIEVPTEDEIENEVREILIERQKFVSYWKGVRDGLFVGAGIFAALCLLKVFKVIS